MSNKKKNKDDSVVTSMASLFFFTLVLLLAALPSLAVEFDVGGEQGWVVPKSKEDLVYNHWASKNRFTVGDSLRFKYKKDSVMVVGTEEEYEKCKSLYPVFFSNTGNTIYNLDHSGTYYIISGAAGHCEKGQKMIVKVLAVSDSPAGSPPANTSSSSSPSVLLIAVGLIWVFLSSRLLWF